MKYFLSIVLLLNTALLHTTANACFKSTDNRRHNPPDFDALSIKLGIDSYQTNELKALMQQHHADMQAAQQQLQSHHKNIHNTRRREHRKDLLKILSYEQLYKLEEYMQKNHPMPPRNPNF